MKKYNVHEAKTNLSKILNEVNEGEVVYIAKAGKIVAEIKAVKEKVSRSFKLGTLKGTGWFAGDWNSEEVNKEITDLFYQKDIDGSNN